MWVAIDTMSGDHGPESCVHGAVQAIRDFDAHVLLVGQEQILEDLLKRNPCDKDRVEIVPADDVIAMDESPSRAVRNRQNASVVVAARLVNERKAVGFFSPGNTGATMASALLQLGRIKGVDRPPIASPLPREDGGVTVLLDAGANVDCKPDWLVQFAIMGEIYAREILGIKEPRLGLLSNGEEDKKGNEMTIKAHEKLRKLPYNFIGNVEGRDIYGGQRQADVVVTDGFTGNIVLKATEGLAGSIFNILRGQIAASGLAQAGAFLLKPTLADIKKRMDYAEYGGAPLLGVNGTCIIGHGGSNATAVKNAIRVVLEFARRDVNARIRENIKRYS